jgi:hypothetical protein
MKATLDAAAILAFFSVGSTTSAAFEGVVSYLSPGAKLSSLTSSTDLGLGMLTTEKVHGRF